MAIRSLPLLRSVWRPSCAWRPGSWTATGSPSRSAPGPSGSDDDRRDNLVRVGAAGLAAPPALRRPGLARVAGILAVVVDDEAPAVGADQLGEQLRPVEVRHLSVDGEPLGQFGG